MPELNDKPKLVHEQVLTLLQGSAQQALDLFREPEVVVVTVIWDARLSDLPGAVAVTRPSEPLTPLTALRCAGQLAKAAQGLLAQAAQQLVKQESQAKALGDELRKLQRELEDREAAT